MSAHLITDDTATPTRLATPPDTSADASVSAGAGVVGPSVAGWLALSAAMTDEVPFIADREDLVVTVSPGAGQGAPACFLPAHATIEVDGTHLRGVDPATIAPHRVSDRARYAPVWGLLTHECAHARHSRWHTDPSAPAAAVTAAMLLEESRIEAAQIRRRPDDRHWLRASSTSLILDDTHATDPTTAAAMTPAAAAQAAALLLARTDAGILTSTETAPVARAVQTVLGAEVLDQLRNIWRTAQEVGDEDAETMLALGRRWCDTLGTNPDTDHPAPTEAPETADTGSDTRGGSGAASSGAALSPLAEAIAESLGKVTTAVANEPAPVDPAAEAQEKASEAAAAERAARAASAAAATTVFTRSWRRSGRTAIADTRPPTDVEKAAARRLARALSTAGIRDRVPVKTTSPIPPGRLRMRGALAADAQRAAGAFPTAEPFTRVTRRVVPTPPLRVGIACDVSGSMRAFAAPLASAAWILAHAANHTPVPATSATVIFGHHVRPITTPGVAPSEVTEFEANDDYEAIDTAIDALDGVLDLTHPGAARLLVIVSDGQFQHTPRRAAQTRVDRLRAAGCAVLWLAPYRGGNVPLDRTTVHLLEEPATTADTIGRAATRALRTSTTH
jgi:VWA domain containing CoxE-like protein